MKSIAVFNFAGRTTKNFLVYHLAHMFSRIGYPTIAVDLDPQANLTSAFVDEDQLENLWDNDRDTILSCVEPILQGTGDIQHPSTIEIANRLWLLAGDLGLSDSKTSCPRVGPKGLAVTRPPCERPAPFIESSNRRQRTPERYYLSWMLVQIWGQSTEQLCFRPIIYWFPWRLTCFHCKA